MRQRPIDDLARLLAGGFDRRRLAAALASALLGAAVLAETAGAACKKPGRTCDRDSDCCARADCKGGTCVGHPVEWAKDYAVQRAFMQSGSLFEGHVHDEAETLVVISGKIRIEECEEKRIEGKEFQRGEAVYFRPRTGHSVLALEDTWMFGITIPASGDYPGGEE